MFQSFNVLPRTSALENVTLFLDYSHQPGSEKDARERGQCLLELVGLGRRRDHHPLSIAGLN